MAPPTHDTHPRADAAAARSAPSPRGQAAVAGLRSSPVYTVVGPSEAHVPSARWFSVERADGAGPGLLVAFDARLVPDARRHLERLAALRDPQLAQIVGHGVDDVTAWLIYAGTLDDSLANRGGPMSMGEIVDVGDALLGSLARAHQAGFLHPGITESLVRMTPGLDGQLKPELLGLGLPLPLGRSPQDDLADVAAILYILYMGRPPFEPGVPRDGTVRPAPLHIGRSGVAAPPTFEAMLMRALGPRGDAFRTAAEMRAAMGPVPGRRTGPSARPTTDPHMRRALVEVHAAPMAPSAVSTLPTHPVPPPIPAPKSRIAELPWGAIALATVLLAVLGWWLTTLGEESSSPGSLAPGPDPIRWSSPESAASGDDKAPEPAPEPPVAKADPPPAPKPKKPLPRIAAVIESPPPEPPATVPPPEPVAKVAPSEPIAKVEPAPPTNVEPAPPMKVEPTPPTKVETPAKPAATKPKPRKPKPMEPLAETPPPSTTTEPPPPETRPPPETAPPPEVTPPPEHVAEPVPTRRVRIVTKPHGVTVRAHGKVLGVTPLVIDVPLADLPLDLVFEKKGYRSSRRTVNAVEEILLDLQLEATPEAPPESVPNPG